MKITCPICGASHGVSASHANRAARIGANLYCGRTCAVVARRKGVDIAARKAAKAEYDRQYRARTQEKRKERSAAWYRAHRDPEKERAFRKANMPRHVAYCRRPEYRAKKHAYDVQRTSASYLEFAEAHRLLIELEREIRSRVPDKYERAKARGYYERSSQQRRRDAGIARR